MRRSFRWTLLASVMSALAFSVAACGGDDDSGSGSSSGGEERAAGSTGAIPDGSKLKPGKQGGQVTFLAAADIDYLDPGQTYYSFGYMVLYSTNRTLYGFKPDDAIKPIPDIAEGEPEISSDNKTLTVKIKRGIKYSPPVDREVKAADIKYAFERAFTKQVPNGYAGTYFNSIEGTPSEPNTESYKPISGITTPDDYTIQFKLKEATAPLISQALVMPITTPVPKEYAQEFDRKQPSTYEEHVTFTGPYMVKNDAQGKITGRTQGKLIEVVRNPNWDKATDFRPAYLDGYRIEEGNDDLGVASRRALSGQNAMCCDAGQPPVQVLRSAVQRNKGQVLAVPGGLVRYIAFNTTVEPFDNINVRKAIIAASNRDSLLLARGGSLIGNVANGWLPPNFPGFEEAGGLKQNQDLDWLKNTKGDAALAKKYLLAAKEENAELPIDANGKWTGNEEVLVVATNADPGKKVAEIFQGQMTTLGFKLNFRIVPQDTLYTKFCGVPSAKVAICPNVQWGKDFTDAQSMLDATFNGNNILQQGNVNWPQLDVPAINDAMKKASVIPVGPERNQAWADINKQIAEQAPAIPYSWDNQVQVASKNVNMVVSGYATTPDMNFSSIK